MDSAFFYEQWQRLKVRFGDRAMDDEFKRLCAKEVHDMSEVGFKRSVDVWIGSRSHTKPPLLSEFREARLNESKRQFDNEVKAAAGVMFGGKSPGERKGHVLKVLSQEFGRVNSVTEAFEIARHRLRVAKAERPSGGEGEGA